jgi:hypothetical protein
MKMFNNEPKGISITMIGVVGLISLYGIPIIYSYIKKTSSISLLEKYKVLEDKTDKKKQENYKKYEIKEHYNNTKSKYKEADENFGFYLNDEFHIDEDFDVGLPIEKLYG